MKNNLTLYIFILFGGLLWMALKYLEKPHRKFSNQEDELLIDTLWSAPDSLKIPVGENGELIKYGRDLIRRTSHYLGPKGIVQQTSNGMNCQNCHLDAGTRPFGNNYSAVFSTYPKFRARSGSLENIPKRINDCFERSLNGKSLDTNSHEMKAIVSYITWLGSDVKKGVKPAGAGLTDLKYMDRPADTTLGKIVYDEQCKSCHQASGEGVANSMNSGYIYPPLWGQHSYNSGAGLYRLSRLAGYAKSNMPWGVKHNTAQLTDEQAWDVAAYINSKTRPSKDLTADWPDIASKPVDHPFGPYADGFSEKQHKYGPFKPIKDKQEALKKLNKNKSK